MIAISTVWVGQSWTGIYYLVFVAAVVLSGVIGELAFRSARAAQTRARDAVIAPVFSVIDGWYEDQLALEQRRAHKPPEIHPRP